MLGKSLMVFSTAVVGTALATLAAPTAKPAAKVDVAEAAAPTPVDQSLTFGEALELVIAVKHPTLTADQASRLMAFVSDEASPGFLLVQDAAIKKAKRHGLVPPDATAASINWGGLTAFLVAILPIILAAFGL